MRVKVGLAVAMLASVPAFAEEMKNEVKSRIGAEFDVAYISSTGNGVKDSKSDGGFAQQKMDLFYHFEHDKTKAMVQFDLLKPIYNDAISMFDDAWVQYSFDDAFNLKYGIEWANNNYYGLNSWVYPGNGAWLGLQHGSPKLEVNGKVSGLTYNLQTWENPAIEKDRTKSDQDSGLFQNMNLMLQYNMDQVEAGVIYQAVGKYDSYATENNVEVKTEHKATAGYQVYGKFMQKDMFDAWLRYTQLEKDTDSKNGTVISLGGSYTAMPVAGFYLAVHMFNDIIGKDDKDVKRTDIDFKVDHKMNANLAYFFQFVNHGKKSDDDTSAAYNDIILGMQARY